MNPGLMIGAVAGLFLAGMIVWVKKIKRAVEQEVAVRFRAKTILRQCSGANFFGQESHGLMQVRGNGILVMTKDELSFQMWKPRRTLEIPVSSILNVTTTLSHLGKSKLIPLLKVIFINADGRTDSAAWIVKDLESWKIELQQLIPQK